MLLSFTVKNYRSFATEATLDMQVPQFHTLRPREGKSWEDMILKRAGVFGPNASGKSNLIQAIDLLRDSVKYSISNESQVSELRDPHKLHKSESTNFITEYVYADVRYRWIIILNDAGITEESLEACPKRTWRAIFNRHGDDITFNSNVKIPLAARQNIEQFLNPQVTVFSAWLKVKTPGPFIGAATWWVDVLMPKLECNDFQRDARHIWSLDLAKDDSDWIEVLKAALQVADIGVQDVQLNEEQVPALVNSFRAGILETVEPNTPIGEQVLSEAQYHTKLPFLEFHHGDGIETFKLRENDESLGTREWIDRVIPAMYTLTHGCVLLVDELDSSLHPELLRAFIGYFGDPDINTTGAQLIFTTHDVTLLGKHHEEILKREEVWFTEKVNSRTELFALTEFNVRDQHNIEKRYLSGVFGAIPNVTSHQITRVLETLKMKNADKRGGRA